MKFKVLIFNMAVLFSAIPAFAQSSPSSVIYNVTVDSVSYSSVRVQWMTNIPATAAWVQYDTVHPSGPFDYSTEEKIYNPYSYAGITIGGLAPNTTYYYEACTTANGIDSCSAPAKFTTAQAPANPFQAPTLPNSPSLPPMPTIDGATYIVSPDCSDLQADINTAAAVPGTANQQILIPPTAKCIGNYGLPQRAGTGWIVVRSAAPDSALPPEGTRVSSSYLSVMPTISAPVGINAGGSAFYVEWCQPTAAQPLCTSNWRFVGLNLTAQPGNHDELLELGYGAFNVANEVSNMIVDRNILTSTPADGSALRFGIWATVSNLIIANNSITVINPATTPFAIEFTSAQGVTIDNNYIDTPGISVFSEEGNTSGPPDYQQVSPITSDVTISHNYFSWDGDYINDSAVRQQLEFKQGTRILIDGNIFANEWAGGITGSFSNAMIFTPRAGFMTGGTQAYNSSFYISDLTITNNILYNVPGGISITGYDVGTDFTSDDVANTRRVLIKNNLMYKINGYYGVSTVGPNGYPITVSGSPFYFAGPIQDIVLDHNTVIDPRGSWPFVFTWLGDRGSGLKLTNNIIGQNASNGYVGIGVQSETPTFKPPYIQGNALINIQDVLHASPNPDPTTTVTGNLLIPGVTDTSLQANYDDPTKAYSPATCTSYWTGLPGNTCAGNTTTITANMVYAYVDFNNPSIGDYSLANGSPYKNTAADGTNPGVDMTTLNSHTTYTLSGINSGSGSGNGPSNNLPSVPAGLTATALSSSQIILAWNASSDKSGVTGYNIYRNGTQVANSVTTYYTDTGLTPSTAYSYTVSAFDASNNISAQSTAVSAITMAVPPTFQLSVSLAGTGFGMVFGSAPAANNLINCGVNSGATTCLATVNIGTNVILKATPSSNSTFTGWSGACSGTGSCETAINANTNVIANFSSGSTSPQTETITATAGNGGTITPSGRVTVNSGTNQTFTLTPNAGYTPTLLVDGTAVPLTNNTYTLSNITASHTVTASFSLQTEAITASAGTGGTISPSGTVSVNYGANQTFTVTPNAGYTASVLVDGVSATLTNNGQYVFTNVTTSHTITASFTQGVYLSTSDVNFGNQALGTTSAVEDIAFINNTASFIPAPNLTITGNFSIVTNYCNMGTVAKSHCDVYVSFTPTAAGASNGTLTFTETGISSSPQAVSLTGTGTGSAPAQRPSVPTGLTATAVSSTEINLSWTASTDNVPVTGYHIFRNGTLAATSTTTSYKDTGLAPLTTYNYTVSAYNASNLSSGQSSVVTATTQPPVIETITASAGSGGTISPSGTVSVNYGASQVFTVTPNAGYSASLVIDDIPVTLTNDNQYTFTDVTKSHTITANFSQAVFLNTYSIDFGDQAVGTSSGLQNIVFVNNSSNYIPTIAVNITGNFSVVTNYCNMGTVAHSHCNVYVSFNPKADGLNTGTLTFAEASITSSPQMVTLSGTGTGSTVSIEAQAGLGGSISPSGVVKVNTGSSKTFTIKPNRGIHISQVQVDGKQVTLFNNQYTFTDVNTSHTIDAEFAINPNTEIIKATAGKNGRIFPSGRVKVKYGTNQTFTIVPIIGYTARIKIDGEVVSLINNRYTFAKVTAAHTIDVNFNKKK